MDGDNVSAPDRCATAVACRRWLLSVVVLEPHDLELRDDEPAARHVHVVQTRGVEVTTKSLEQVGAARPDRTRSAIRDGGADVQAVMLVRARVAGAVAFPPPRDRQQRCAVDCLRLDEIWTWLPVPLCELRPATPLASASCSRSRLHAVPQTPQTPPPASPWRTATPVPSARPWP